MAFSADAIVPDILDTAFIHPLFLLALLGLAIDVIEDHRQPRRKRSLASRRGDNDSHEVQVLQTLLDGVGKDLLLVVEGDAGVAPELPRVCPSARSPASRCSASLTLFQPSNQSRQRTVHVDWSSITWTVKLLKLQRHAVAHQVGQDAQHWEEHTTAANCSPSVQIQPVYSAEREEYPSIVESRRLDRPCPLPRQIRPGHTEKRFHFNYGVEDLSLGV